MAMSHPQQQQKLYFVFIKPVIFVLLKYDLWKFVYSRIYLIISGHISVKLLLLLLLLFPKTFTLL